MRILILSPSVPSPTWGFGTRVYQFLRLLAREHSVTLLAYAEPTERGKVEALRSFCTAVHTISRVRPSGGKRLAQMSSLLSPTSYQWRSMYSEEMQRTLDELSSAERFDVIQL